MDVSVVIPAKNEEKNIHQCLNAIFNQRTSYTYEVIVIDSGSTDQTIQIIKKFAKVKLIQIKAEEFGHGKTRNLGAEIATGDFIVFLNADAIPVNHIWLHTLVDNFQQDESIAGIFSRHIPRDDCHLYMARDIYTSMPPEKKIRNLAGKMDLMIFSTVSAAIRKKIWKKLPLEHDIVIAEDQEWATRIIREGFKICYEPDSKVYHSHNYTPHELYHIKKKVSTASKRYTNRLHAILSGFPLVIGGLLLKVIGDVVYILFKPPKRISGIEKIKQIKFSIVARAASFWGRFIGWVSILNGAPK